MSKDRAPKGRSKRPQARPRGEAKRRDDPRLKARLAGLMKRWRDHLRWAGKDDPDLASLPLVRRGNRLSVMPVGPHEAARIVERAGATAPRT